MGLTGKAAANNVNWFESVNSPTISFGISPIDNSTICSSPGGLLCPPPLRRPLFVEGVSARRDLRLVSAAGVGQSAVAVSDIVVAPHVRPVLREHGPAKRIDLDLPLDVEPSPIEPQIEAPDPGEQTANGQHSNSPATVALVA